MGYQVEEGDYRKFGVQLVTDGAIFTFAGAKESECAVLLYDERLQVRERICVPTEYCIGAVRSIKILGIPTQYLAYNYEIDGEVHQDSYANRILGRDNWRDESRATQEYSICCGCELAEFEWGDDKRPEIPRHEMVMYKLHVRGFSMDAGLRGKKKGTFAAVRDRIPYLRELGVTTLEFMPVYEFEEMCCKPKTYLPEYLNWQIRQEDLIKPVEEPLPDKVNYWGYVQGNYFAVKASYASTTNPSLEWKELVHTLHANGMECVMEVYVAEETNQNIILDALRYWVREYHVDGFHLLGDHVPITLIAQDVWLARTKIFYTGFDGNVLHERSEYPHLFVYSDEYLYPVRKMLNHYNGTLNDFICQQRKQHSTHGFVNYIADNNGFSLLDLFSYEEKHNAANGEDNCDGSNWNYSSNYGVEGRTNKRHVREIRERQMCNAVTILMCGQGVPLLYAGDEFGNSQSGNNNAYCQDNAIGWINWKQRDKYAWFTEFVRRMIAFRNNHPGIATEEPKRLSDFKRKGFPDLSYHSENAWVSEFAVEAQAVGVMYCGDYAQKADGTTDDDIYIGYNFHLGLSRLALPKLSAKKNWYLVMDTGRGREAFLEQEELQTEAQIPVKGQSIVILIGK